MRSRCCLCPCVRMCVPLSLLFNVSVSTTLRKLNAAIEELLNASFSMPYVSDERKVGDKFFPDISVVLQRKGVSHQTSLLRKRRKHFGCLCSDVLSSVSHYVTK
jgi:hypothetical protein